LIDRMKLLEMRNYLRYVELLGTAHWSRRSIVDAATTVDRLRPQAVCIELDKRRFDFLRQACFECPRLGNCKGRCEFMVAIDALGNQDADIWLMDMDEEEIAARLRYRAKPEEIIAWRRIDAYVAEHNARGLRLWEEGLNQEALDYFNGGTELMRRTFPTLWQVLIHERNLLMASRLIFITEEYINMGIVEPRILAIVGAAHVPGMRRLLVDPLGALRLMEQSDLEFTPPVRIHKVRVS